MKFFVGFFLGYFIGQAFGTLAGVDIGKKTAISELMQERIHEYLGE